MAERERYIFVSRGVRIFANEVGSGPPVLLCDGLGCDGYVWRDMRPALARNHRVLHWNYRGHGKSDSPREWSELSVPTLIKDMLAVLDHAGVERCVLIGHSMGVQVILQAALDYPERFSAVVPICGSYGRPLDTFRGTDTLLRAFPAIIRASERFGDPAQKLWSAVNYWPVAMELARLSEMNHRAISSREIRPYFEHMASMDVRVFIRTLSYLRHHTVEERLPDLIQPALVIAGENDTFTPVWLSRKMSRLIPRSELLVVPDGTHVAPLEAKALVTGRVVEFVEEQVAALRSA